MSLPIYKSEIMRFTVPVARVSVGNPDIADLIILQSTQLYVLGKDLGTTNVLLWDRSDNLIQIVNIEVTHDLRSLKEKYYRLLPNEKIEVYSAQKNIVLAGRVSNITNMNAAIRIAEGYFSQMKAVESETFEIDQQAGGAQKSIGEVINLMSVGGVHQVMLEVKVAEIQRTELKRLDVRFSALLTGSSNWIWGAQNEGVFRPAAVGDTEFFASYLSEDALFNLAFDAAKVNGLAKILAEPTLIAMSGETAQFNSGGEIGYLVGGGVGVAPTTEFKDFGVSVWFLPVVLDSKRISLELRIEVSELAPTLFLGAPSFLTRKARTTVELADGQTLGIAGLINEDLEENVSKFPGLGSIPVLGALFRTQNFEKRETELLIMVTPHLVKPNPPADFQLPTNDIVESGDFGWYLQGKLQSGESIALAAEFGDAVRNVMDSQIHDYDAALHPPPDAIEGSDPDRLNTVIDTYRKGAGAAQEAPPPISISVGGL
ncbi:MAG: type II and III secretion system protein family protein [Proteobacteria bacterium]|nr:type II and III secretion system protein family protein [Pseudomonadota bacterium]